MGVFEDLQLLFPVAIAGKGIAGVGIAIQVDAARDPDRDQAEPRRFCGHRQGQSAAQAPQPANDHPDEREGTHGIPHVFWFHANCGTGRAENMAKATAMVCNPIIFHSFIIDRDAAHHPHHMVSPGGKGIVHLRQRFQVAPGVACIVGTTAEHLVGDHDEVRALSGQLVQSFQNGRSGIFSRPAGS